jgi:hypothetical protein
MNTSKLILNERLWYRRLILMNGGSHVICKHAIFLWITIIILFWYWAKTLLRSPHEDTFVVEFLQTVREQIQTFEHLSASANTKISNMVGGWANAKLLVLNSGHQNHPGTLPLIMKSLRIFDKMINESDDSSSIHVYSLHLPDS